MKNHPRESIQAVVERYGRLIHERGLAKNCRPEFHRQGKIRIAFDGSSEELSNFEVYVSERILRNFPDIVFGFATHNGNSEICIDYQGERRQRESRLREFISYLEHQLE